MAPASNPVASIASANALQLGPVLYRAVLDMDRGYLLLIFSKAIAFTSLDPTQLTLVGNTSGNSKSSSRSRFAS